jgi:hypothetical protein
MSISRLVTRKFTVEEFVYVAVGLSVQLVQLATSFFFCRS